MAAKLNYHVLFMKRPFKSAKNNSCTNIYYTGINQWDWSTDKLRRENQFINDFYLCESWTVFFGRRPIQHFSFFYKKHTPNRSETAMEFAYYFHNLRFSLKSCIVFSMATIWVFVFLWTSEQKEIGGNRKHLLGITVDD